MLSIKELYNIGYGPSSSHTMGPAKAAHIIKEKYPEATFFEVVLYNSLALTGKGHLTHQTLTNVFLPKKTIFYDEFSEKEHPNTLIFKVYKDKVLLDKIKVVSAGGARIIIDGVFQEVPVYPHKTFNEIKEYLTEQKMTLIDYVIQFEGHTIDFYLKEVWKQMQESIKNGLSSSGFLPGELKVKRKAQIISSLDDLSDLSLKENRLVSSYAFAVSEENANGNIIVTAPTCGASGVLPAILYYLKTHNGVTDFKIIEGLMVAGLIGNLIKYNASISGAEAGCQAEIGSATAMGAAAYAYLNGYTLKEIEYAAEVAIEHQLGLTCDPVKGYVQIPCIERNAVAAMRAIDAARLSKIISHTAKVSFDTVVKTMYQTGKDLASAYRETAKGGLAFFFKETE